MTTAGDSTGGRRAQRPTEDSVERTLRQVGDAWTFLLMREAFFGVRRFDDFRRNTRAAPNIVTDRLRKLVDKGIFSRVPYSDHPLRHEYRLTEKGRDLYPVTVALMAWGDRWLDNGAGPPLELVHTLCENVTRPKLVCSVCERSIIAADVIWRRGPGGTVS